MHVLHVLSQTHLTGAEVYAVQLANWQCRNGHTVTVVSDKLHIDTDATFIAQPIHNRKYGQRLHNIRFLRELIREQKIDVVHAHSRASSWVSYFAVKGTRVPLISTVHGRQHLHTSTRLFDMYGDRVLAVCAHLRTHLIDEVKMQPEKIQVVPNGFAFTQPASNAAARRNAAGRRCITLAGRSTGPKGQIAGEIIVRLAPGWLHAFPDLQIDIVGGEMTPLGPAFAANFEKLKLQFADRLNWVGFTHELPVWMAQSVLVIGSGRVAIEALSLGTAVAALGEACYEGIVTNESLARCMASNFGDILPHEPFPPIDYSQLDADVRSLLEKEKQAAFDFDPVRKHYAISTMAHAIEEAYYSARFKKHHPRPLPVLMYHKVLEKPSESQHRIFVTKETFTEHLAFFKRDGFTTLTFKQYDAYKRGTLPLTSFPRKPILLTFDDAYQNNIKLALPLLQQHGMTATVFALGDAAHTDNFWDVAQGEASEPLMTRTEKQAMQAAGVEFGAHSMNHVKLTEADAQTAQWEIAESKRALEEQLGKEVIVFAYPYGLLNEAVKQQVKQAGYKYAVAIDRGGLHLEDDPLEIFRVYIFPQDRGFQLWKKTRWWYRYYIYWKKKK